MNAHTWPKTIRAVLDPDLGIGGGPVIQALGKGGGGCRSPKNFFWHFRPQFGVKIRGQGGGKPLPCIHHCREKMFFENENAQKYNHLVNYY